MRNNELCNQVIPCNLFLIQSNKRQEIHSDDFMEGKTTTKTNKPQSHTSLCNPQQSKKHTKILSGSQLLNTITFLLPLGKAHWMLVLSILTNTYSLKKKTFLNAELKWKLSFHQRLRANLSVPSCFYKYLHVGLSQLTLHNASCLKLPRLLDDKGTGRVGLLHRRSHLAVPHAHWCLRKFMAQL